MTRKMQFYIQNSQKLITNLCILPSKNYKTKKEKNRTSKLPSCTIQRHSRVFLVNEMQTLTRHEVFSFSFFEKRLAYEVMTHDCDRGIIFMIITTNKILTVDMWHASKIKSLAPYIHYIHVHD